MQLKLINKQEHFMKIASRELLIVDADNSWSRHYYLGGVAAKRRWDNIFYLFYVTSAKNYSTMLVT